MVVICRQHSVHYLTNDRRQVARLIEKAKFDFRTCTLRHELQPKRSQRIMQTHFLRQEDRLDTLNYQPYYL